MEDKLKAYWSKSEGLMLAWPLGVMTKSDAHWLSGVFSQQFTGELLRRGYDLSTLRFSIRPDLDGPRAVERFPTLKKERAS